MAFAAGLALCMADNSLCWAKRYGFTPEWCCPPWLDPVGNIACWWEGYEFKGHVSAGGFSYVSCCNASVLARARDVLSDLMERANRLPYLKASSVAVQLGETGLLPSRYVINFGAADGTPTGDDPTVPLFLEHGFAGLAVEPDAKKARRLRANMPEAVVTMDVGVTPWNVAQLLEEARAPPEPAFLKVDIDSFDCAVLLASLRVSRPALIQVEVNAEVPFPLAFGVHYDGGFQHSGLAGRAHGWFSRGFFGCSAALAADLVQPFGYDIVGQAGAHDVLFLRSDLRRALQAHLPSAPMLGWTPGGIAKAVSVRSMKDYFGTGVGASWLFVAETQPERLLELVAAGVESSCRISQGLSEAGTCAVNYTLALTGDEFRQLY